MRTNFLDTFFLCFVILMVQSCVTTQPYVNSFRVPVELEGKFSSCRYKDGYSQVHVFEDTKHLFDSELEWISDSKGKWEVAMYVDDGRTAAELSYENDKKLLNVKSGLLQNADLLTVGDDGHLEWDGYWLPLKASEVACLLAYQFPFSWTQKITHVTYDEKQRNLVNSLTIRDERRDLKITFAYKKSRSHLSQACAKLSWSSWWGMRTDTMDLCFQYDTEQPSAKLLSEDLYKVYWMELEQ